MTIFLNDNPVVLPNDYMTIADLVKWKNINPQGTAIALNNKLVRQDQWSLKKLTDQDQVTVISAAFGG